MWSQERIDNREKYCLTIEQIKNLPKEGEKYIHLGCGQLILDNWINIDKYVEKEKIVKMDIYDLSFPQNSVDGIYSSHSLEHLPIRHARKALKNWYNTLKPGGVLFLAIPDLEETMLCLLNKNISFADRYFWFLHVLFGYQTDSSNRNPTLDAPLDLGQFHTCGFTEELITFFLKEDGYKIEEIYKYEGWGTPSIFIKATK